MLIKEQFFKRLRLNTFFTKAVNSLREVNFHKRVISHIGFIQKKVFQLLII